CIKSTYALKRNVPTENLPIVNCQVSGFAVGSLLDGTMKPSKNQTGRIKFGTEASGGFRNVTIANCTFRNCRGLALEEVDGALMDDISIENLTMLNVRDYAIYLTTGRRYRGGDIRGSSEMKHIFISNVIAEGVDKKSGIQIMGLPGTPIQDVHLKNIRLICDGGGTAANASRMPKELGAGYPEPSNLGVMPAYGVFARHVKDLELDDVTTSFETNEMRPAMICSDVNGLEINDFKPETAAGVPAAKWEDVSALNVRNSPALAALHLK
ncbi:MAG: glycoside hydrolase family 28 protein, partial [Verrucomicrobia bacterium]|nr:glycoside hydrolase family 28 protein [Verrucomicrobiota bacterium]